MLPPSITPIFLLVPFVPSSSLIFSASFRLPPFNVSLSMCICPLIHLSSCPSINFFAIYLPSIMQFDALHLVLKFNRSFALSSLFLSTSLSNSTYLPSLLPFDTLSPCPLIQSSPISSLPLIPVLPCSIFKPIFYYFFLSIYVHQFLCLLPL